MGYWISHSINASGSKEDIDALASKLTQRRPKKLNDEGDIEWSEEEFSFYNILPPPEEMLMSGDWWDQVGEDWRVANWQCYDVPAEEFGAYHPSGPVGVSLRSSLQIRLSTKYDWPVNIFHDLVKQNPNLAFNIWSEGEESEAVHIVGESGASNQTDYAAPESHADWGDRGEEDNCWCANYDDPNDWYADCPRDELGIYKVELTYTHYVKAYSMELATESIKAYDNGFDMPSNTEIVKYAIAPSSLAIPVDEVPDSK
jgi:hypothetical protein